MSCPGECAVFDEEHYRQKNSWGLDTAQYEKELDDREIIVRWAYQPFHIKFGKKAGDKVKFSRQLFEPPFKKADEEENTAMRCNKLSVTRYDYLGAERAKFCRDQGLKGQSEKRQYAGIAVLRVGAVSSVHKKDSEGREEHCQVKPFHLPDNLWHANIVLPLRIPLSDPLENGLPQEIKQISKDLADVAVPVLDDGGDSTDINDLKASLDLAAQKLRAGSPKSDASNTGEER